MSRLRIELHKDDGAVIPLSAFEASEVFEVRGSFDPYRASIRSLVVEDEHGQTVTRFDLATPDGVLHIEPDMPPAMYVRDGPPVEYHGRGRDRDEAEMMLRLGRKHL